MASQIVEVLVGGDAPVASVAAVFGHAIIAELSLEQEVFYKINVVRKEGYLDIILDITTYYINYWVIANHTIIALYYSYI